MSRYIVRRLLVALPAVFIASVVTVGLRELIPDELLVARVLGPGDIFGEDAWAEFLAALGFGQSFPERYVEWVGDALRGDLGESWWSERGVTEVVATHSRVSISLFLIALPVAFTTTAAHSVLGALRPRSRLDRCSVWMSRIGAATPEFIMAMLGAYMLYALVGWEPPDRLIPAAPEWPIAALVVGGVAAGWYVGARTAIDARSARRDGRGQGYVLTARAKGLGDASIMTRHVLPNATVSALGAAAGMFPLLLGSVLMVEVALGLPGVGYLAFERADMRDYPVMEGVVLVTALCVIASNLVVDVASAAMDPRIRKHEGDARPRYAL